jgi:hypothetical protein
MPIAFNLQLGPTVTTRQQHSYTGHISFQPDVSIGKCDGEKYQFQTMIKLVDITSRGPSHSFSRSWAPEKFNEEYECFV